MKETHYFLALFLIFGTIGVFLIALFGRISSNPKNSLLSRPRFILLAVAAWWIGGVAAFTLFQFLNTFDK